MTPDALAILTRLDRTIRERLERFGSGPDRFGLTHADLRIANLLVDGDRTIVIDFDDCGLAWFMYDWATAVSFIEDHPQVPELQAAWVEGYRAVAPLSAEEEAELPTFVMLRRLLLVAWIGSHHTFATEAAELGAGFTIGTCELAESYLSSRGPSMFTPITGRSVLVTGGTKGIGKGIAHRLRERRRERGHHRARRGGRRGGGARPRRARRDGLVRRGRRHLERRLRGRGRRRRSSGTAASTFSARTPASSRCSASRT